MKAALIPKLKIFQLMKAAFFIIFNGKLQKFTQNPIEFLGF